MTGGDFTQKEDERRKLARISNHFLLRSSRAGDEEKIAGIVHDLNPAGVSFVTEHSYGPGETIELEIELVGLKYPSSGQNGLLNSAVVVTTATVVRTETFEIDLHLVAVYFTGLEEDGLGLIQKAVSYL